MMDNQILLMFYRKVFGGKEKPLNLPRPSGLFGKRGFSEKSKEAFSHKSNLIACHLINIDG